MQYKPANRPHLQHGMTPAGERPSVQRTEQRMKTKVTPRIGGCRSCKDGK